MSETAPDVSGLVEYIAKALVDAPDQVLVNQVEEDDETVLELEVAENDMGKVIGRQGRVVRAMRTLLDAVSDRFDRQFELEILE
jgi:predicted RNA-binding protein YlqC (UPF0109 family)